MDERAALLSRAVADVEERTHVDSRRRWGRSTKARASGGANGSAMRAQGADGVESVADDRTEVEDEDYGTGPSSPTIVSDDDAAVLDRDRGGWRHRRVSSLWALIGVASVVGEVTAVPLSAQNVVVDAPGRPTDGASGARRSILTGEKRTGKGLRHRH